MLIIFGIAILVPIILTLWEGWFDFLYIMLSLLLAFMVFIVMLIPTTMAEETLPDQTANVEKTIIEERIYAFEDNIVGTGNYFLFSGSYNEEPAYYYIVEREYGVKTEYVYASKAYIKFDLDADEKPYKEVITYKGTGFVCEWILLHPQKEIVVFHIPKDSVKEDYNVDLK
jgi:hypothetical protein